MCFAFALFHVLYRKGWTAVKNLQVVICITSQSAKILLKVKRRLKLLSADSNS